MSPMNGLNQNNGGDVPEYIDIAKGLWPLFLAGFAVAIATGATHVKKGYLQRNKLSIALNIILSSAVSSAISLGFALLAPLFYPGITADMKLGIVLVINGIGLKLVDVYMRKKHGLQVVDLSDTADIHELRKSMTPEQRRLHAQDCPFKGSECCGGTNQSCTFQSGGLRTPKAKKSEHPSRCADQSFGRRYFGVLFFFMRKARGSAGHVSSCFSQASFSISRMLSRAAAASRAESSPRACLAFTSRSSSSRCSRKLFADFSILGAPFMCLLKNILNRL